MNWLLLHRKQLGGKARYMGFFASVADAAEYIRDDSDHNPMHWELHKVTETWRFASEDFEPDVKES